MIGSHLSDTMAYCLFFTWLLLNILDTITTLKILNKGGSELNPLLAYLFDKHSPLAVMVSVKGAVLLAVFIFLSYIPIGALIVLNVGYLFLILWNLNEYRKMRRT